MQDFAFEKIAQAALENSGLGYFHVSLSTGEMSYSPMYSIILTGVNKPGFTRNDFLRYVHADDLAIRDTAYLLAGTTGKVEYQVRTIWDDGSLHWARVRGTYLKDEEGNPAIMTGTIDDVTAQVVANEQLSKSEWQMRSLITEAPFATALYRGRDLVIDTANFEMIRLWGKGPGVLGKHLHDALPELEGQDLLEILDEVYVTGKTFHTQEALVHLRMHGEMQSFYFNFTYKPLYDPNGHIYAILNMAVDVTDQVLDRRKIEESELFSRSVFYNSPVAKMVFTGTDMIIKTVNEKMLAMLGRDESIIGKPFLEAIPELLSTPLLTRMVGVFQSGETYYQPEEKISLYRDGVNYHGYYNYIYKPLHDINGQIYGIMVTATEVTEQVLSRQQVEIAEANLRSAVELAELATWSLDIRTLTIEYSERLKTWCGFGPDETLTIERAYETVIEADRPRMIEFFEHMVADKGQNTSEILFTVKPMNGGRERIIQSQGKCFLDENGEPYKISGTAQDVTTQRKLRMALEQQVQSRTEELSTVNEKLRETNEQLFETNKHLLRSNEELAQYAYVASHDLQEPLRKIRMFTDILHKRDHLEENNRELVAKINNSAARMSLLIESLLEFSRLLKSDLLFHPVDLNKVVSHVRSDFELIIQEKNAEIQVGELISLEAISLQMNQFFYNLIGNALKFTRPGVKPVITITGQELDSAGAIQLVPAATQFARYYHITIRDNGIGIESQYADQIFEVFKRLHPRDIYPGSGIGLALCRRIATNHNGHITIESVIREGTSFHVLLPIREGSGEK